MILLVDFEGIASTLIGEFLSFYILFVVYLYAHMKSYAFSKGNSDFRKVVASVAIILLADIASNCIMSVSTTNNLALAITHWIFLAIFFQMQIIAVFYWLRFVYAIFNWEMKKGELILSFSFIAMNAIFVILSFCFPFGFFVDPSTAAYSRGPFFPLLIFFPFIFILWICIAFIIKKPHPSIGSLFLFLGASLVPLGCAFIQYLMQGFNVMWPSAALAIFTVFIFLTLHNTQFDPLTGINNRMQFEDYLSLCLRKNSKKKYLYGVMLDLDRFKVINDTFGHKVGDVALTEASNILKKAVGKEGFLARYAGDEFVVIYESNDLSYPQKFEERLREEEDSFNEFGGYPFHLRFSFGYRRFGPEESLDTEAFLDIIDQEMYKDKHAHNKEGNNR